MELPIFLSLVSQKKHVMDGHILSAGVLRLCCVSHQCLQVAV